MTIFKKKGAAAALALALSAPAQAVNWVMLQGTELPNAAPNANFWGFIQPTYYSTEDSLLQGGPWQGQKAVFNQIAPELKTNDTFLIRRARIGVRGQNFPLNPNINYFLLAEFGKNGITSGDSTVLTDASITLNYVPGARVRVGQFKYPGSEEGFRAIHVFDYINFTNVTDQLLLERFFDRTGDPACTVAAGGTADTCANRANGPVGAFRDIGVQVFDAFPVGAWEHTYAVMLGNGNGIARADNDDNKDLYLYLSTEKVFGGQGPRRGGLKLYAWSQNGKRQIVTGGTGTQANGTSQEFDRKRYGGGVTYRQGAWRTSAEYVKADGMIFTGTDGGARPGALNNAGTAYATFNIAPEGEANGYYVDLGYRVLPKLELDLRWDRLNRETNASANERRFTTTTLGMQYFFDPKNRITVNYEIRDAEAPNLPASSVPNRVLDSLDNRISVQLTSIF